MVRFAVIAFPGTTGETETVRAFRQNGMEAEIVLWNDAGMIKGSRCDDFDGYCLPGGMSFGDYGRGGLLASRQPILEVIRKEAAKGKVILGIGNGAEILVESGMIPGYGNGAVACAVERRMRADGSEGGWSSLRNVAPKNRSAFNRFAGGLRLVGMNPPRRFVFGDPAVLEAVRKNSQIVFRFGDQGKGRGSDSQEAESIAALCNPSGNVLAILSHPEQDPQGGGNPIFQSIREWIESRSQSGYSALGLYQGIQSIKPFAPADVEFIVRTKSVDNERKMVEAALEAKGLKVNLKRYTYWSAKLKSGAEGMETVRRILESGVLANLNKDWVTVRIAGGSYQYKEGRGLQDIELDSSKWLVVCEKADFVGSSIGDELRERWNMPVESLAHGILWEVENADDQTVYEVIRTKILYNPNSMFVMRQ
jgi:phosphoribosylformylglycinamidine synthase